MTKQPAPIRLSISLIRAAFFHARVGDTPALCAMLDRVELIDLLLERGASLDVALADGSTALSMALGVGAQRAAQLLLAMSFVHRPRWAE